MEGIDAHVAARRFGDRFAPDLTELHLWGAWLPSETALEPGGYGLGEEAIEAALSDTSLLTGTFSAPAVESDG
jgi:hypothetical protein